VPHTLRNPLYHWTHLELRRYFGVRELLGPETAEGVWGRANEQLAGMSVHRMLERQRVAVVCTTDDPADSLEHHRRIRDEGKLKTRVYPAFRPDKALAVDQPGAFNAWCDRLSAAAGVDCRSLGGLLEALRRRHDFFHEMGGRLSDHGLNHCFPADGTADEAASAFDAARAGREVERGAADRYRGFMMRVFGEMDAEKGWVKQLHLGAMRGNNSRMQARLGPDTGFDSIGDWPQAEALSRYMDALDRVERLPKMILYNLNPRDNYAVATMIGNFMDGRVPGKIQFGSGWWFLDQKEAMEWQINALSNLGLLSRFVGMLTDSRSFMSFPRHEYFRRILCNLIGRDAENGELPRDVELLGEMVRDVCFRNAAGYFGMTPGDV
jgi:glucuronate isomerase